MPTAADTRTGTAYLSRSAVPPAPIPDVPAGTVLHLRPGQWGWDTTTTLTLTVTQLRRDLRNWITELDHAETGDSWVWVEGTVDGVARQVRVRVSALPGEKPRPRPRPRP